MAASFLDITLLQHSVTSRKGGCSHGEFQTGHADQRRQRLVRLGEWVDESGQVLAGQTGKLLDIDYNRLFIGQAALRQALPYFQNNIAIFLPLVLRDRHTGHCPVASGWFIVTIGFHVVHHGESDAIDIVLLVLPDCNRPPSLGQ